MFGKNLLYVKFLLLHKLYVFREGRTLGVSVFRLIIHDWQKLTPTEWGPYVRRHFGLRDLDDFLPAWFHHLRVGGKHHWQQWVVHLHDGSLHAIEMPDRYRREMVADWRGAARTQGHDDVTGWYGRNREMILLHTRTRIWVENEIGWVERG